MADAPVPEDEDAAQELARLSDREVPAALNELGQKHQFVNDVIQWCESSYSSGDKNAVMDQTKEYLVDALETVARDVEETSAKLVRALALQADAVDHLALDLDVVKERLAVAKEQNAQARLDAFRPPAPARAPRKPTLEILDDAGRDEHMASVGPYEKDVRKRLDAFADVGARL